MPSSCADRSFALPVLLGAQLAVGAAAIFARYALEGAQPLAVAALRLLIATAVLQAIAAVRKRDGPTLPLGRRERTILAFAGLMLAVHFVAWIWSLEYTTVAISTLLVTTTPLFTTLYDVLIPKRAVSPFVWLAYIGAAGGLFLVVGFARAPAPLPGHTSAGIALALIGSIGIGAYLILVREVRTGLSTRTIVSHTYGWAAAVLVLGAAATHQGPPPLADTASWLGILAMAFISQLLGHTALNASLRFFSPSVISTATLLEPIFAAVLAAALFAEALSATAIAGGLVVLGAIGVVMQFDRKMD